MLELAITWLPIIGTIVIGLGISIWYGKGNKKYAIWIGLAGAILVEAGFSVHLKKIVLESQVPADRPIVLPVDIGQIRLHLPNGQTSVPHVKFRISNYGKSAAVLRRVQAKFMMLELPLTKEKATGNDLKPGQTQISSWTNSTVLGPGDTIETDAFSVPESIRIDEYHGHGRPNFDTAAQLFLFVTIDYEDLNGDGSIGFTCWKYEHPSNGIFAGYGGKDWNYEQETR